jgi:hypothetical protein
LFSQGVARAALDADALIIDGGTHSGVMKLIGQGVADHGYKTRLLGVTPVGKALYPGGPALDGVEDAGPLDPNHSHFCLAGKEWGDETETLFALAKQIVDQDVPVVAVLAGSSALGIAKDEMLRCARNQWPIVVLAGSGPLADQLARLRRKRAWLARLARWIAGALTRMAGAQQALDPDIAEIVDTGVIRVYPTRDRAAGLYALLAGYLRPSSPRSGDTAKDRT